MGYVLNAAAVTWYKSSQKFPILQAVITITEGMNAFYNLVITVIRLRHGVKAPITARYIYDILPFLHTCLIQVTFSYQHQQKCFVLHFCIEVFLI